METDTSRMEGHKWGLRVLNTKPWHTATT